jgi:hypothetical protein
MLVESRRSLSVGVMIKCPNFSKVATNSGKKGTKRLEQMQLAAFQMVISVC